MVTVSRIRRAAVFLLLLIPMPTHAGQLDMCVVKICLGKNAPTYTNLIKQVGSASRAGISGIDSNRTICLYDHASDTSEILSFSGDEPLHSKRLDGIFVARGMLCAEKPSGKAKRGLFKTTSGIKLGDDKAKVIAKLGEPSRVDDALARETKNPRYLNTRYASAFGQTRLHYEKGRASLLFNQFGIDKDGQVASIWISSSP